MKRFISICCIALLFAAALAGCGNSGEAPGESADVPGSATLTPTPSPTPTPEISEEDLLLQFEAVYNSCGADATQSQEKLPEELEKLKANAASSDAPWPKDYEAQYKTWRADKVKRLLEAIQNEYNRILSETPLYDYVNSGAAYADYFDFDGDGVNELLIVSLTANTKAGLDEWDEWYWEYSVNLYGYHQGHVKPFNTDNLELLTDSPDPMHYIALVQKEGRPYFHTHQEEGKTGIFDDYYTVSDGAIVLSDTTTSIWIEDWDEEAGAWNDNFSLSSGDKELSAEEYDTINASYTNEFILLDNNDLNPIHSRGILPELSLESQRRVAMLEALADDSQIKYATLIDTDRDGTEELVVLTADSSEDYSYYFRIYSWDGASLQITDLNKASDPKVTFYMEEGAFSYSIQKETSSGDIYFAYVCEIGGGLSTLFINADDYKLYEAPFWEIQGKPEEEWTDDDRAFVAQYEADLAEYEANLARFTMVEDCGEPGFDYDRSDTVDAVWKQLVEG